MAIFMGKIREHGDPVDGMAFPLNFPVPNPWMADTYCVPSNVRDSIRRRRPDCDLWCLGRCFWGGYPGVRKNGEATIGLGFPRDNSYVPYVHGGFSSTQ